MSKDNIIFSGSKQQDDTDVRDFSPTKVYQPQRVAVCDEGMASTQHFEATKATVQILESGGNAIDAAVAGAFALGVCEPAASGLGGQTMMMIHLARTHRTFALDGSSRAPNRTSVQQMSKEQRLRGYKATTVPSTPAVLMYALEHFGTFSFSQVLQPAIALAENGYRVSNLQCKLTQRVRKHLQNGPAAKLFLKDGKKSYKAGEKFKQPVLAATLRRLARKKVTDFYHGQIGKSIHEDMAKNDGLITKEDLAQIPWPIERKPVSSQFGDYRIVTFPPPGAGRTLVEMLNIISHIPKKYRNVDTPDGALMLAQAIKQANRDRKDRPFEPNFYAQVPQKRMLSTEYARDIARWSMRNIKTGGDTTHLSVMDRFGNIVALTQSIERVYGACVATPELGFLYNNYMMAFENQDMKHPYYLRPNAVPWASVAPTIIFKGRRPWMAIGSPGSQRIVSSIAQVFLRLAKQLPFESVDAPRLHCSAEGAVSLEASRMRSDIPALLEKHGFSIDIREPYSFYLGSVQLVINEDNKFIGVADPRRDGEAGGPSK
jgi:gamma-glutamyltranspeptidase/glutathione hydrolase